MRFTHLQMAVFATLSLATANGLAAAQSNSGKSVGGSMSAGANSDKPRVSAPAETSGSASASNPSKKKNKKISKAKRGNKGDGSVPTIRDDPQHRCLAPSGIC